MEQKPPIGVRPRKYAERDFYIDRLNEINEAIIRYNEAKIDIPSEWITEAKNLKILIDL